MHWQHRREAAACPGEGYPAPARAIYGASSVEITLGSEQNHVHHDVDGELFLETRIFAAATGRPDIRQLGNGKQPENPE